MKESENGMEIRFSKGHDTIADDKKNLIGYQEEQVMKQITVLSEQHLKGQSLSPMC